jgi:hypothetical protein
VVGHHAVGQQPHRGTGQSGTQDAFEGIKIGVVGEGGKTGIRP